MSSRRATFSAAFSASPLSLLLLLLCCPYRVDSLVVPQELPSILSLVYSNIPPIKKGTDSRLGFGFRLGEHADFQVMLELGPQKETRPIGDKDASDSAFNKRQVSKAQQNHILRQQLRKQLSSTERTGASWLENWSQGMNDNAQYSSNNNNNNNDGSNNKKKFKPKPHGTAKKKLPPALAVPAPALRQLQLLYQMATTTENVENAGDSSSNAAPAPSTTTASPLLELLHTTPSAFKGGRLNLGGPAGFTARPPAETLLQSMLDLRSAAQQKSKSEITKELMDVSLEDGP